ncbi:MAG: calcium/sodium antiporter [Kofleriaceae bacterium]|nr:calcium/sodium antiporter [Myxococcales bacterium]MCB9573451.1 calcium/sodium antiporter [Kofleriaceae bacterium]
MVLLYFGAEWLVGGSARLASSLGVKPLIVGLTVVAYGTSAPELVVGVGASLSGQGAIALGNVIGSNVANIGLILAVAALIQPPVVDPSLRRREVPVLVLSAALLPLVLIDGVIERWEGAALLVLAIGYTYWMVRTARHATADLVHVREVGEAADEATLGAVPNVGRGRMIALAIVGLVLLVAGGHFLVVGAVGLARRFGMSERLIGLTIVAVGTSLPELATSIIAAMRGHSDLAVGNVIGSNIFNVLLILGGSGLAGRVEGNLGDMTLDLVVLGVMTVVAAVVIRTRDRVSRLEAAILLLGYVTFLMTLALSA